ncbi:MAG: hypothetical protein ACPGSL_04135 [Vicingaceae bacterium]
MDANLLTIKHILLLSLLTIVSTIGNAKVSDIYLLGNLKSPKLEKRLRQFSEALGKQNNGKEFTLLLLGDIRQKKLVKKDSLIAFLKRVEQKKGKIIAVTGDRDWDKSNTNGLDTVIALENRFNYKLAHKIFTPTKSCLGPTIKDIRDNIRIIGINSQWWLHPYRNTISINSDCKSITKVQILDEISDAIESANGKQVIIVSHHPIISGGVYGDALNMVEHIYSFRHDKPNNKTFLPVFGSFYLNYRRNIGSEQDMSSKAYTTFIKDIEKVLRGHKNIILCSIHEYDMEVLKINNNFQIISGSLLKSSKVEKMTIPYTPAIN